MFCVSRPLVYLAGPITGLDYQRTTEWRERVSALLAPDIVCLSPMRSKTHVNNQSIASNEYPDDVLSSAREVITRSRWDTMRCDLLLVNLLYAERLSIGTIMEVAWADAARKPIVLAMEDGGLHEHAMIQEVVGFRVTTSVEDAAAVVRSILLP